MLTDNSYIGTQINNYRVIQELANGGFGTVYLAQHIFLANRTVAIKIMHTNHLSSEEERESFLQEARFLEILEHPYILPILDVGIHENFPYLMAEYAHRGSLRDRLKRQKSEPLPLEESLTILSQIGQALEHAHQQNIIHRDLKPENILFNAQGDALLADFGVATILTTSSLKNVDNIGTPSYMAPEQFRGTISRQSDQYALGCIAYELVTGQKPFDTSDIIVLMYKHATEYPVAPTQIKADIPVHVEQAILKAMAKERSERYPDIDAFIAALCTSPTSQLPAPSAILSNNKPEPTTPLAALFAQAEQEDLPAPSHFPFAGFAALPLLEEDLPVQSLPSFAALPLLENAQTDQEKASVPSLPSFAALPLLADRLNNPQVSPGAVQEQIQTPQSILSKLASPEAEQPLMFGEDIHPIEARHTIMTPKITSTANSRNKSRRGPSRKWFRVAMIALLLLLVSGSMAYALSTLPNRHISPTQPTSSNPGSTPTETITATTTATTTSAHPAIALGSALVTLTPASTDLKRSYTISAVTGTPNASQVQARLLSFTTSVQTQTATATGTGTLAATAATGTLTIDNYDTVNSVTFNVNDSIPNDNNSATQVVVDAGGTVPIATSASTPGVANISVHVVPAGMIGNIVVNGFYHCASCSATAGTGWSASNPAAFTGGQDAKTYSTVQQSDIDGATNSLKTSLLQQAQTSFQAQIRSNEHLVSAAQCTASTSSDHAAGDTATSVTVSGTAICKGEVYDQLGAQSMADRLLANDASTMSYRLTGNTTTVVNHANVVNAQQGTISLLISAESMETFQFSNAQKQAWAKLITGKKTSDAQALLLQQPGVAGATIAISPGETTLPTDPTKIAFTVGNTL